MILWLILALMTAAAMAAAVWRLVRGAGPARSGHDVAVYRDQLDELERDLAAGLIGATEAEAARAEISRRSLAAAAAEEADTAPNPISAARYRRAAILAACLFLPIGAGSVYLWLGSPELASDRISGQQNASWKDQPSTDVLIARVEAHLQRNPDDGRAWEVLAPVYMQLGRYTESANAWKNALQFLGEDANREANLGESLFAEANGVVTDEAKAAFQRATTLDSTIVSARYYLGIAAEQDGNREEAARIWRALVAEAPDGAHWLKSMRTALERVGGNAEAPVGPSPAQVAATAGMPADQQSEMIRGMVARLAARLKENGSDPDGWVRLVRSYKVLGEADNAQAAISEARRVLAGDADKQKQFDAAIKMLEGGAEAASASPVPSASSRPASRQHEDEPIQNMVERLAQRVRNSRMDVEGWVMLARSYVTLGEKGKAEEAIRDARATLAADAPRLRQFNDALTRFGIDQMGNAATPKQSAQ